MITRTLLIAAVVLATQTAPCDAQDRASPSEVVRAFFDAQFEERWHDAAVLFHPDYLADFKERYLSHARDRAAYIPPTIEDILQRYPDMSREAAENRLETILESQGDAPLRYELGLETVAGMDPVALLTHNLEVTDLRAHFRNQLLESTRQAGGDLEAATAEFEGLFQVRPEVVGHALEDDWAWVLYRTIFNGAEPPEPASREPPDVIGLRRSLGGWWIYDFRLAHGLGGNVSTMNVSIMR